LTDAHQPSAAQQPIVFTREQLQEIKAIAQATAIATIRNMSQYGTADPYRRHNGTPVGEA
jgi:hypothetical protein